MMQKILLATTNHGKIIEMKALLRDLPLRIYTPDELNLYLDVEENGKTYLENAVLKASIYAEKSGLLTLADDTGLEVEALNGAPGLHSARFVGRDDASDHDRRQLLLERLAGTSRPWLARFVCSVVLEDPSGKMEFTEGECKGEIIPDERGTHGFGYDPLFFIPTISKTMAELSLEEKNRLSHRAMAVKAIYPLIESWI